MTRATSRTRLLTAQAPSTSLSLACLDNCDVDPDLPGHCHTQQGCDSGHRRELGLGPCCSSSCSKLGASSGEGWWSVQTVAPEEEGQEGCPEPEASQDSGESLGEDWLADLGLVDTHVRHWVVGELWLLREVFILDQGRRASPEGRSESPRLLRTSDAEGNPSQGLLNRGHILS